MTALIKRRGQTLMPIAEGDDRTDTFRRRIRILTILVVVLLALLVAAVAWVVFDDASTSETAVTDEIQQLLDDYHAAWNGWDPDAYLALVTDDAVHRTPTGSRTARQNAGFVEDFRVIGLHIEPIGAPIAYGDDPWYVAQALRLTATTYPEGRGGILTLTIVDDGGTLKVSRHIYSGRF